jgi:hypothetical protein
VKARNLAQRQVAKKEKKHVQFIGRITLPMEFTDKKKFRRSTRNKAKFLRVKKYQIHQPHIATLEDRRIGAAHPIHGSGAIFLIMHNLFDQIFFRLYYYLRTVFCAVI